jgi:hypothetical protein
MKHHQKKKKIVAVSQVQWPMPVNPRHTEGEDQEIKARPYLKNS